MESKGFFRTRQDKAPVDFDVDFHVDVDVHVAVVVGCNLKSAVSAVNAFKMCKLDCDSDSDCES